VRVVLWGVSGRAYAPRGEDFRDIPQARTGNRPTFNAISSARYLHPVLRMLVRLQRQAEWDALQRDVVSHSACLFLVISVGS
jgi:hypothetical protein